MLMTQSQDGRRHSGDQAHHPDSPNPRNVSVEVTRDRAVNHPSVDAKDLPLDAINEETDALLSEQGSVGFCKRAKKAINLEAARNLMTRCQLAGA